MSTDYRVTAASSHWWILPPAITQEGEIDHDRLLSRVNKAFCLNAVAFFTAGPYALLAPSFLSCCAFWGPTAVIQGGLWFDEYVTETVAAEIKAKKDENEKNPPAPLATATRTSAAGQKSLRKRVVFTEGQDQGYPTRPLPELATN